MTTTELVSRLEAFEASHPGLYDFLAMATWSDFAQDLAITLMAHGQLSDRQLASAQSMRAKCEARNATAALRQTEIDLAAIFTMFDKARDNGLKKLIYRAKGLKISPASASGANAGALYVKTTGGEYLGKVVGSTFKAVGAATPEHKALLAEIAVDPSKVARDYGKETGQCCLCGRELSDPESVARGVGPICEGRWGL